MKTETRRHRDLALVDRYMQEAGKDPDAAGQVLALKKALSESGFELALRAREDLDKFRSWPWNCTDHVCAAVVCAGSSSCENRACTSKACSLKANSCSFPSNPDPCDGGSFTCASRACNTSSGGGGVGCTSEICSFLG
jgi:hypothetical protein